MMKFKYLAQWFAIPFLILSCEPKNPEYILNETFSRNNLGWIEESTNSHCLKIESGFYFIHSKDTSENIALTSTSCLDKSHLIKLPEEYEIETRIKLVESEVDNVSYGLFLIGASIQYSLYLDNSGTIELFEYDYTSSSKELILSEKANYSMNENQITIKLAIFNKKFFLFVNNYLIAESEFRVKSWQDLRIFTTSQSKIAIDYLRIVPVTLESIKNSPYDYDIKEF